MKTDHPDECFKPFIFDGLVSLTDRLEDQQPMTVLRDTSSSQSSILASVLPCDKRSTFDSSNIVKGFGMCRLPAPLHLVIMPERWPRHRSRRELSLLSLR